MNTSILSLSPHFNLHINFSAQSRVDESLGDLSKYFEQGSGSGLFHLGLRDAESTASVELNFWKSFSQKFFLELTKIPSQETTIQALSSREILFPADIENMIPSAPPFMGAEYLGRECLEKLWRDILLFFREDFLEKSKNHGAKESKIEFDLEKYFKKYNAIWNLVGRVSFHLVENKKTPETPFAFLATYSHKVSQSGKIQYLPLSRALTEYASQKSELLKLLTPIHKGTLKSAFLKKLVESSQIYHPQAWTPHQAYEFLKDIAAFEEAGILIKLPNLWAETRAPRPQVSVTLGQKNPHSLLSAASMLEFSVNLTLDGENLTAQELHEILQSTSGLALIRGKWVELDKEKIQSLLDHWKTLERSSSQNGLSFMEGMRLLSGAAIGATESDTGINQDSKEWFNITAHHNLSSQLKDLSDPQLHLQIQRKNVRVLENLLQTALRPYQQSGVEWLFKLHQMGLGGCLADDMGLGKTLQVISLLLLIKNQNANPCTSLLVLPASLLGNWQSEIERFAPSLKCFIAHPSNQEWNTAPKENSSLQNTILNMDLVMTTYGYLGRVKSLLDNEWKLAILDEAQAIKDPNTTQSKMVKQLKAQQRLALTGTPIENNLGDLWSLYDYLCPGLLGTAKDFDQYIKKGQKNDSSRVFSSLKSLIKPYLLRRLKTDKNIISDLPDKTELLSYCSLTKKQAALYQETIDHLKDSLKKVSGIERRGIILASLMRLKQICNHPSQWLGDGSYEPDQSGKFYRLRELCEEIASKQEKVLIFTQFKEITQPISQFLESVFQKKGLLLHGETRIQKRKEYVEAFQKDDGPPFFVLSLKAGGSGLNLTAASHVIHFDRWWNPAVENQATDEAFRIGQKKNVLVHKFLCKGTLEEHIEELINAKKSLSQNVLGGESMGTAVLTEMSNEELLKVVAIDIHKALREL